MNATINGSKCSIAGNPTATKLGITSAYCLIFVVSLIGNSFICIIVYKTKTMRKPINFLIVNMAMSDLLFPIFLFPWSLASLYVDSWLVSGPFGLALCKLSWFLPNVSTVISIQSLILIAVDRFGAVAFPLRSPVISTKMSPFFILATWIVGIATCSPYLLSLKLVEKDGKLMCAMRWSKAFGESSSFAHYMLSVYVVVIFIPFALLTILYTIIVCKLNSKKIPGEQSTSADEQRIKTNRRVVKMAIAIAVAFLLCWSPISIFNLLNFFAWERRLPCSIPVHVFKWISIFMAQANCAINPWICFTLSGKYRQGVKRLLKCCAAL